MGVSSILLVLGLNDFAGWHFSLAAFSFSLVRKVFKGNVNKI